MSTHRLVPPPLERSTFVGYRFPPEVILLAVRWYMRYGLSYRDVEELLAERDIDVDHVTIHRWVQRFTTLLIDAARPCRHTVGGHWSADETYVKVAGRWRYVRLRDQQRRARFERTKFGCQMQVAATGRSTTSCTDSTQKDVDGGR